MQFNFISIGAIALFISSVVGQGIHLGGKRAPLADDCKRSYSAIPNVALQTTAVDPQPTAPGTGSGGPGNKNGTTPKIVNPTSTGGTASAATSKSDAGTLAMEWTMGAVAAAGAIALAF